MPIVKSRNLVKNESSSLLLLGIKISIKCLYKCLTNIYLYIGH